MPDGPEAPDPGGTQAAIDRYRDLAKYAIGIFGAVGGLMLAGIQLTSLGKLSVDDTPGRLVVAVLGLGVALGAIVWVITSAAKVLRPIEMSLQDIDADPSLVAYVNGRRALLGGAESLDDAKRMADSSLLDDAERQRWQAVLGNVVEAAALRRAQQRFDTAWSRMWWGAGIGAVTILAFAWAANPPKPEEKDSPIVSPAPASAVVMLTEDGRSALRDALGETCDSSQPLNALAIGGTETRPKVVTLSTKNCNPATFVLDPDWGHARDPTNVPLAP